MHSYCESDAAHDRTTRRGRSGSGDEHPATQVAALEYGERRRCDRASCCEGDRDRPPAGVVGERAYLVGPAERREPGDEVVLDGSDATEHEGDGEYADGHRVHAAGTFGELRGERCDRGEPDAERRLRDGVRRGVRRRHSDRDEREYEADCGDCESRDRPGECGGQRRPARDGAGADHLQSTALLFSSSPARHQQYAHQRDGDRAHEAVLVADDAADVVDAMRAAVDGERRAVGPTHTGRILGDLRGSVVDAVERPRGRGEERDHRDHPDEQCAPAASPVRGHHDPEPAALRERRRLGGCGSRTHAPASVGAESAP